MDSTHSWRRLRGSGHKIFPSCSSSVAIFSSSPSQAPLTAGADMMMNIKAIAARYFISLSCLVCLDNKKAGKNSPPFWFDADRAASSFSIRSKESCRGERYRGSSRVLLQTSNGAFARSKRSSRNRSCVLRLTGVLTSASQCSRYCTTVVLAGSR